MKRVFLIVLDSVGCGYEPDADKFGDVGANTLYSASTSPYFHMPNMKMLGYFNTEDMKLDLEGENYLGIDKAMANARLAEASDGASSGFLGPEGDYAGSIARLREKSMGKDTTIGHWELAGLISENPLPTYPDGFPDDVIEEFKAKTGCDILCNKPYSGTAVINDYGDEHMKTGALIVYTSADSVFQIAAHEDVVPVDKLYEYCQIARDMLQGQHGVGRVIARPFVGESGNYTRTTNRHDFSLLPPKDTMLDVLQANGYDTLAVGKIYDIFAGKGISEFVRTSGNEDGINKTLEYMDRDFEGLCFVNLVDYDMLYGHRRDIEGYAKALTYFDERLLDIIDKMRDEDLLMITADHGCDPGFTGTDHTREYVPLLMFGPSVPAGENYATRESFADCSATILNYFGIENPLAGESILY